MKDLHLIKQPVPCEHIKGSQLGVFFSIGHSILLL